ncbi:MAG: MFS transporter [Gammaproteobacteria bacterium]|nr:MFS transporter [Gammaproteobacteria bacterium]
MPNHRAIPFSSKFAFGVGQFAEGLKSTGFGLFILFYYNQILGLSGTLAGMALFIALLFDAITDPLAGSLSDNWRSRWGRRHPFMYASAIPLALAFLGLFSPPEGLGEMGLFIWLTLFAVLTRGAMTLYHVPHLALGAEMTEDFHERTRIVAYRQFFGTFGSLAAAVIGLQIFFSDAAGGRLAIENYPPYAITLGILMVVTIWYSAWGTQKEVPYLAVPAQKPKRNIFVQLWLEISEAARNQSFRWLFFGVLIVFIMSGVNGALDLYMYQYFWELTGQQMTLLLLASTGGLMLGVFLTATLHRYTSKLFGVLLGTAVWAFLQLLPVVLRLLEWFPLNHTTELVSVLFVIKLIQGIILQQAFISFGSMMADVADEHEYEFGVRQEGIFFGAIAFSAKATSGFGNFLGGLGLDLINWPRGTAIQKAADVPAETLVHLGLLYGPVVAAFSVISLWCYSHYKLTRERHNFILGELHLRRINAEKATV